jgi:hypothetical protein
VFSKAIKDFLTLGVTKIVFQSFESIVHHIVVMDFFWRYVVAEFEPDRVEKVDFFWREVRSMWAKIELLGSGQARTLNSVPPLPNFGIRELAFLQTTSLTFLSVFTGQIKPAPATLAALGWASL